MTLASAPSLPGLQERRWYLQGTATARRRRGERGGAGAPAAAPGRLERRRQLPNLQRPIRLRRILPAPSLPAASSASTRCGAHHHLLKSSPPVSLPQAAGRPYRRRQAGARSGQPGTVGRHSQRHAGKDQWPLAASAAADSRRRRRSSTSSGTSTSPGAHVCCRHAASERRSLCCPYAHCAAPGGRRRCRCSHRSHPRSRHAEQQHTCGR